MFPTFFIPAGGERVSCGAFGSGTRTASYTPSVVTPEARAGDLAVLVVNSSTESGTISLPSGWKYYRKRHVAAGLGGSCYEVYYKVLTQGDLTTSHAFTHGDATAALLGRAYTFSNFHPDVPFEATQFEGSSISWSDGAGYDTHGFGYLSNKVATVPEAFMFDIFGFYGASGSETVLPAEISYVGGYPPGICSSYISSKTAKAHVAVSRARDGGIANLLTGEDYDTPFNGWTPTGLTTADTGLSAYAYSTGVKLARLTSSSVSGKHYVEKTVNLTAGQTYTYNLALFQVSGGYSPYASGAMSVIPPSGAAHEFGLLLRGLGQEPAANVVEDPDGGHADWWWGSCATLQGDGLPNFNEPRYSVVFVAQESGDHTLRYYVTPAQPTSWSQITHSTARTEYVRWAALLDGLQPFGWMPGGTPPTCYSLVQDSPALQLIASATPSNGHHMAFQVNPNAVLPSAYMVQRIHSLQDLDADGLGVPATVKFQSSGNDSEASSGAKCLRPVYPTFGGSATKYYAELTYLSGSTASYQCLSVVPTHASIPDLEIGFSEGYVWYRDGSFVAPSGVSAPSSSAWSASANDKFGVMVDFDANQVVFYKNGVATGTINMKSGHDELPFELFVGNGQAFSPKGRMAYRINFSGPFTYLPSGARAWDVVNEVT